MRRVCDWPGCGTILSRYNETDRCGAHETAGDPWWYLVMTPADRAAYLSGEWLGEAYRA